MEVELDLEKSLHANVSELFEKSKRARSKAERIKAAIAELEKRKTMLSDKGKQKKPAIKRKLEWYEKFHWCFTSDGLLLLAGRDAKTNEMLIKRYFDENDLYFHADIHGAAHCILKNASNASEQSLKEAASFAAIFSRAWKRGFYAIDVYSARPEQISKKAPSRESLATGAFMVYGKRTWYRDVKLEIAVGIEKYKNAYRIISGPKGAIEKKAIKYFVLVPGRVKKSDVAKKLKGEFEKISEYAIDIDEIMRMLPAGEFELVQSR